jgi:hypothetical protein
VLCDLPELRKHTASVLFATNTRSAHSSSIAAHAHAHTYTYTHAQAHTHTHTQIYRPSTQYTTINNHLPGHSIRCTAPSPQLREAHCAAFYNSSQYHAQRPSHKTKIPPSIPFNTLAADTSAAQSLFSARRGSALNIARPRARACAERAERIISERVIVCERFIQACVLVGISRYILAVNGRVQN